MTIDRIATEALKLPLEERIQLAASLWESIEDPYALAADREDEDAIVLALARDAEIESGKVTPLSHSDLMRRLLTYSAVENYLETYSTTEPPYDFNGLLHLVLAGTENLRQNAIDQNVLDYACSITDDQALFLRRLLESRDESNAQLEADA